MPKGGSSQASKTLDRYNKKLKENNREFAEHIKWRRRAIHLLLGKDEADYYREETRSNPPRISKKFQDNERFLRKAAKSMRGGYKD